jgi:hypothetical protein
MMIDGRWVTDVKGWKRLRRRSVESLGVGGDKDSGPKSVGYDEVSRAMQTLCGCQRGTGAHGDRSCGVQRSDHELQGTLHAQAAAPRKGPLLGAWDIEVPARDTRVRMNWTRRAGIKDYPETEGITMKV